MTDRHRVWADIEARDEYDAEALLRAALQETPLTAHRYGATGRETYNGWRNYETWAVHLWITNDESTCAQYCERGRQALADANDRSEIVERVGLDRESSARADLADDLKTWVTDELLPDLGATLAADLLGAAVSDVDWYEIAGNLLDEMAEERANG